MEQILPTKAHRRDTHTLALKQHLEAGRTKAAEAMMFHKAAEGETAQPQSKYVYEELKGALERYAASHPDAKIALIRHGQTSYTTAGKITGGGTDIPLNEDGVKETRAIAQSPVGDAVRHMADHALVFCSDLTRAQQTKNIFLGPEYWGPESKATIDHQVAERRLGHNIEGTADGPARKLLNKIYHDEPDAEGSFAYMQRTEKTLIKMLDEATAQGKDLIVFGHSNWIATAMAQLMQTEGKALGWNGKVPTGQPIMLQSDAKGVFTCTSLKTPTAEATTQPAAGHPHGVTGNSKLAPA